MTKEESLAMYITQHKESLKNHNPNLILLSYIDYDSSARYMCCKCNSYFEDTPSNLAKRGYKCANCETTIGRLPTKILGDMRPDLIKWLKNSDDAFKYGYTSTQKVDTVCPYCGHKESIRIRDLTKRAYPCQYCNKDGISRPNKFLREFLKEISDQVDLYETEWNPDWAGLYLYDGHIVVNGKDWIIEMNGEQHYKRNNIWDYDDQVRRDTEKAILAEKMGIEQIIIDCRKSDFKYIKQNIIDSRLSEIINLSNINWATIIEQSSKDYVKVAANLYNDHMSITDIGRTMLISPHTVSALLSDANEAGLCKYNTMSHIELQKKTVKITNTVTNQETIIHSIKETCKFLSKELNHPVSRQTIRDYCRGYRTEYYGGKHICPLKDVLYKGIYRIEKG